MLDSGRAIHVPVHWRVHQEFFIVALGEISSLVGASRFGAMQRALHDCFRHVKHEPELHRGNQFRVECKAAIVERCSRPSVLSRSCFLSLLSSSTACAKIAALGALCLEANSAAARPARAPKTRSSGREFEPSRFAPLMLTQATSPAAYKPGSGVDPLMSVCTPPIM